MTARRGLVKFPLTTVLSPIQLVDDHLPDLVGSRRAFLGVALAFMRDAVGQGVRPDWDMAKRSGNGCIIEKVMVCHNLKHIVASDTEEGRSESANGSYVCKAFQDKLRSVYLCHPVIESTLGPVIGVIFICNGRHPNFVTLSKELLN